MSDTGHVTYSKDGAVGRILFDRPEARNALTPAMYAELDAICAALDADDELRVVVLRGAGGKSFVSGSDIAQFLDFASPEDGVDYERRMERHLEHVATIRVPTVAVIEGYAVGGGLNIAACCDIRIATTGTKLGTPIAKALGNCLSINNYARLLQSFGEGRTGRMLMLGEFIAADEALACGFLSRIVDPADLDAAVAEIVGQLAANSPLSMQVTKQALARLTTPSVPEIDDLIRIVYGSDDFAAAVRAFIGKTKHTWTGR